MYLKRDIICNCNVNNRKIAQWHWFLTSLFKSNWLSSWDSPTLSIFACRLDIFKYDSNYCSIFFLYFFCGFLFSLTICIFLYRQHKPFTILIIYKKLTIKNRYNCINKTNMLYDKIGIRPNWNITHYTFCISQKSILTIIQYKYHPVQQWHCTIGSISIRHKTVLA